jgi:hypothetical protein
LIVCLLIVVDDLALCVKMDILVFMFNLYFLLLGLQQSNCDWVCFALTVGSLSGPTFVGWL